MWIRSRLHLRQRGGDLAAPRLGEIERLLVRRDLVRKLRRAFAQERKQLAPIGRQAEAFLKEAAGVAPPRLLGEDIERREGLFRKGGFGRLRRERSNSLDALECEDIRAGGVGGAARDHRGPAPRGRGVEVDPDFDPGRPGLDRRRMGAPIRRDHDEGAGEVVGLQGDRCALACIELEVVEGVLPSGVGRSVPGQFAAQLGGGRLGGERGQEEQRGHQNDAHFRPSVHSGSVLASFRKNSTPMAATTSDCNGASQILDRSSSASRRSASVCPSSRSTKAWPNTEAKIASR